MFLRVSYLSLLLMNQVIDLLSGILSKPHKQHVILHKSATLLSLLSCVLLFFVFLPKTHVFADTFLMGDSGGITGWQNSQTNMVWSKYTASATGAINQLQYGEGYIPHPANVKIGIYTASGTLLNSAEYSTYSDSTNILVFPPTDVSAGSDYYIGLKGDRQFLAGCTATQSAGKSAYWNPFMPYSTPLTDFTPSDMNDSTCSMPITAWQVTTNWSPSVIIPYTTPVKEGDSYSVSGSFSDFGSTSWTATVNYGDGGGTQPLTLNGQNFTLNHIYTTAGTYTVTVSVTDNQGATGTRTAPVTITTDTFLMGDLDPIYSWAGQIYMVWSKYTASATGTINQIHYGNGYTGGSTNIKIGFYTASGTLLNSQEYLVHQILIQERQHQGILLCLTQRRLPILYLPI